MATKTQGTLDRRAVMSALLDARGDSLIVTGLGSSCYDAGTADHPNTFYLWGGMGAAAMMGLGLALAQPTRRVVVVTGDGEMLMAMGAFATIGAKSPKNLSIVVIDNEHYSETGMQPTHTGRGVDLSGIAEYLQFPHRADGLYREGIGRVDRPAVQGGEPDVLRHQGQHPALSDVDTDARRRSHQEPFSGKSARPEGFRLNEPG